MTTGDKHASLLCWYQVKNVLGKSAYDKHASLLPIDLLKHSKFSINDIC